MFAKWCQEIFFKYMRQQYNLCRLVEYGTETIPDAIRVINSDWRELDSQIRRQNGLLSRELLQFAEIQLPQEMESQQAEALLQLKAEGALKENCHHRPVQYLNNVQEQDHRTIKRRVRASQHFRSFWGSWRTIGLRGYPYDSQRPGMLECGCEGRSAPSLYCWYVRIGSLIHWSYRTRLPFDSKVATLAFSCRSSEPMWEKIMVETSFARTRFLARFLE
jgi:transposase-like protein